jgi:hypothetical protein
MTKQKLSLTVSELESCCELPDAAEGADMQVRLHMHASLQEEMRPDFLEASALLHVHPTGQETVAEKNLAILQDLTKSGSDSLPRLSHCCYRV